VNVVLQAILFSVVVKDPNSRYARKAYWWWGFKP